MRPRNQYKREPMERYKKKLRVWHCAALRCWYSVNSPIAFSRIVRLRLYLHFVIIEAIPLRIPNRPSNQLSPITPSLSSPFLSSSYGARGKYVLCCIWAFLQFPRRFLQMGIPTEYMACCLRLLPCWQQSSHLALTFTFLRCRFSLVGRIFEQALHTKFEHFYSDKYCWVFNLNSSLKLLFLFISNRK